MHSILSVKSVFLGKHNNNVWKYVGVECGRVPTHTMVEAKAEIAKADGTVKNTIKGKLQNALASIQPN